MKKKPLFRSASTARSRHARRATHGRRATRHVAIAATEIAPVPKYVYICNIIYKCKCVYVMYELAKRPRSLFCRRTGPSTGGAVLALG